MNLAERNLGPIHVTVVPFQDALSAVTDLAVETPGQGHAVHFCNAFTLALADTNANYSKVLNSGTFRFCDGMPLVWVGRKLYPELGNAWERVYGPDVMSGVLSAVNSRARTIRHYLLGASPQTMARLVDRIGQSWPYATIAGFESPPFRAPTSLELRERDERIRLSGANIVWVGLGTPKQDYEAARLAQSCGVMAIAVGAAFDFIAGTKAQAPAWLQSSGLEWAFRLASEPSRLWYRYAWGNSRFLYTVGRRQWVTAASRELQDGDEGP